MRRYKLEFKEGARNHAGCACLARKVSTNIENPDYEFLQTNFSSLLEARHNKDDEAASAVLMGALMSGNADNAGNLMTMMGYMSTCSNRTSEQEIRQSYIAETLQNEITAGSVDAATSLPSLGLRSDMRKPTAICTSLTDEEIAQREAGAKEAGLRFDRATCKMFSL